MTTHASALPLDENLPEVVPDSSPQAIFGRDAYLAQNYIGERDPKYAADTSPKPVERDLKHSVGASPVLVEGEDGVWRPTPETTAASPYGTPGAAESAAAGDEEARTGGGDGKGGRICGLRRRTFWIVLVVVVVVVAAAIGGGVGGGIAARNSRANAGATESPDEDGDDEATPSPTESASETSTPSSSSSSPSSTPTVSFLNNQTVPSRGIAFQAFSGFNYTGDATEIYTGEGFTDLGMEARSYVWIPNTTKCCVSFCQNTTKTTQFWCDERYRPEVSKTFPRVGLLCGPNIDTGSETQPCS